MSKRKLCSKFTFHHLPVYVLDFLLILRLIILHISQRDRLFLIKHYNFRFISSIWNACSLHTSDELGDKNQNDDSGSGTSNGTCIHHHLFTNTDNTQIRYEKSKWIWRQQMAYRLVICAKYKIWSNTYNQSYFNDGCYKVLGKHNLTAITHVNKVKTVKQYGSSVPQRSNLGCLWFLLFINNLFLVPNCEFLIYVDDMKIYLAIKTT